MNIGDTITVTCDDEIVPSDEAGLGGIVIGLNPDNGDDYDILLSDGRMVTYSDEHLM